MVSLQRTARLVSGTPTRKKQACGTGPEGLAGDWRRRDVTNRQTHRERRKDGVEDCDQVERYDQGQTRGRRLDWTAHTPVSPGLQAREGGNALGSRPSLVRVPMQLPGN